jgi:hypothetical protein
VARRSEVEKIVEVAYREVTELLIERRSPVDGLLETMLAARAERTDYPRAQRLEAG